MAAVQHMVRLASRFVRLFVPYARFMVASGSSCGGCKFFVCDREQSALLTVFQGLRHEVDVSLPLCFVR